MQGLRPGFSTLNNICNELHKKKHQCASVVAVILINIMHIQCQWETQNLEVRVQFLISACDVVQLVCSSSTGVHVTNIRQALVSLSYSSG